MRTKLLLICLVSATFSSSSVFGSSPQSDTSRLEVQDNGFCDIERACISLTKTLFADTVPEVVHPLSESDPDLEPGFPVLAYHSAGTYQAGPVIHTLIGNINASPQLEIIVTGLANGPLYAWNSNGQLVKGWPVSDAFGVGYPALGNLSNNSPGFEVFLGHRGFATETGKIVAYTGSGFYLPGWPRGSANYVSSPAALADINRDGIDEIFIGEEDWHLHAYSADGTPLPGWPQYGLGSQTRNLPAIADLDKDGDLEIITTSGVGVFLFAYHHNGALVNGFPVTFSAPANTFPAIGDVDGDSELEIIVSDGGGLLVFSGNGLLKRRIPIVWAAFYGSAVALADFDNDSIPEIVHQSDSGLDVKKGDGSNLPGWPVMLNNQYWQGSSSPVVGDVDGDNSLDIVITRQYSGSSEAGEVRVYNSAGQLHPHFPKQLPIGASGVPAIADIDLDGRNEIIITGSYWNGIHGFFPKVWVFDLGGPHHGKIDWGQLCGGPQHHCLYGDTTLTPLSKLFLPIVSK